MNSVPILINAIDAALKFVRLARDGKIREEEHLTQALNALYVALSETKLYIVSRKRTGKADRQKEEDLSRLWVQASIPMRYIDQDLADRCMLKGDYWADPGEWNDERIEESRIEIGRVFAEARELIRKR